MVVVPVVTLAGAEFQVRIKKRDPIAKLKRRVADHLQAHPSHISLFIGTAELSDDEVGFMDSVAAALESNPDLFDATGPVAITAVITKPACLFCSKPLDKPMRCGRCGGAYCGNDCQLQHWGEHKHVCEPEEVD